MSGQRSGHEHDHGHHHHPGPGRHHSPGDHEPGDVAVADAALITDPVCGMRVDPATSKHRLEHGGTTFHFCSAGCRTKFEADPDKYLKPETAAAPTAAQKAAIYTCPMHPEIRQQGPGNCPICGMALEPLEVTAEAAPNHELADMTRRFWTGLALTLPLVVLEMGGHIPGLGLHRLVPPAASTWVQLLLATPVVLWAGWPFFVRGWRSVVNRSLNMFSLIALGTGAAYLYSVVATLAPGAFPEGFRGVDGTVAVYFVNRPGIGTPDRRRIGTPSCCAGGRAGRDAGPSGSG